jgi:hypothetical protein
LFEIKHSSIKSSPKREQEAIQVKNGYKQVGVKKDKFVGAGLGIMPDKNHFLRVKTRPAHVVFIFTYLIKCGFGITIQ